MGLMGHGHEGEQSSLFADINVTPLVDVMLVLLIIFMVTAPFMIETIGVNLPKGQGAETKGLTTPLTISIDGNEKIFVAGQQLSLEQLEGFFSESPRIKNGEELYIEADQRTPHRTVMAVMVRARKAGAVRINLMMETDRE
jgi:biopolymer transport protein TolR